LGVRGFVRAQNSGVLRGEAIEKEEVMQQKGKEARGGKNVSNHIFHSKSSVTPAA